MYNVHVLYFVNQMVLLKGLNRKVLPWIMTSYLTV